MEHIIVVTSNKEQQEVISNLCEALNSEYHTDLNVTVSKISMTTVKVFHRVKESMNVAATYRVILIPISMSLDSLMGLSPGTNINVNKVLAKLDGMKTEVITFVNMRKATNKVQQHSKKFAESTKRLFE
jgi:membrane protein CcdC involved in cytochrome C biogenesis